MSRALQSPWLLAAALAVALPLASPVPAAIPSASKIAEAVAEENDAAGRSKPLLLEVSLRIGDATGQPAAQGVLATHPTGLARLELRSERGFVERHLLQGHEYRASRDGVVLESSDPSLRPFLPPIFLLQASSAATLAAALESYGVLEQEVVLGRLEDHDAYVFGGRLPGVAGEEQLLPSLWIDVKSYQPLRMVREDGVEYRLGPLTLFDGIRLPGWIDILAPGERPARLEIRGVEPANAPAAAFQSDWLTAPASAQ